MDLSFRNWTGTALGAKGRKTVPASMPLLSELMDAGLLASPTSVLFANLLRGQPVRGASTQALVRIFATGQGGDVDAVRNAVSFHADLAAQLTVGQI